MPMTLSPTTSTSQTSSQTGQTDVDMLLGGFSPAPPPVQQESSVPDPFVGKDPFSLSGPFNGPDPFATPDPFTVLSTLNIPLNSLKPSMYMYMYMYLYNYMYSSLQNMRSCIAIVIKIEFI